MSVTRFFYVKQPDGSMPENPTEIGAKASNVTIVPPSGEGLLDAQSEFARMWQVDIDLNNKISTEILDRQKDVESLTGAIATEVSTRMSQYDELISKIADETEARDKADDVITDTIVQEIVDRQNAIRVLDEDLQGQIDSHTANITKNTGDIATNVSAISKNAADIQALKGRVLYAAEAETEAITEDITLDLVESECTYVLINCEYNGKRMPACRVLTDGVNTELVLHSLTDEGISYIGMEASVSENQLTISNIVNNDELTFKVLNVYGYN